MDEQSDPNIVSRLQNQPPFVDENGTPNDNIPDTTETAEPVENVQQEVVPLTPEVTEEDAIKNSKNPERTQAYIDKLKTERDQARSEARYFEDGGWTRPVSQPQMNTQFIAPQVSPQEFPNLTQQQINDTRKELVDENGYVDTNTLKAMLAAANDSARAAMEESRQTRLEMARREHRYEEERRSEQVKKVHKKFPQLDPNDENFNPKYWDAVRDRMVNQIATTGKQDFYQAAKDLYEVYNGNVKKAEKEKIQKTQNQLRNINATTGSQNSQRMTSEEQSSLVQGTRMGTKGSLAERLRRNGY